MRTFIAIDIPDELRGAIRALLNELRSSDTRLRWSRPEGLHITLKFLGEVSTARIGAVKDCLASIAVPAPFPISIQGSGYFPKERSPRVIWLGVQSGDELHQLASAIDSAMHPLGFAKENRPYSAHLTLARTNGVSNIGAVREILQQKQPLALGSFTATEYFLYESTPSPGGSVYTKLARFPLSPESLPPGAS